MYRRFDPARGFEHAAKKMNEFFNDFDKGFSVEFGGYAPRVDITEDEKMLYLHVELAGVKKEDVKLSVNDENVLIIKGEKRKPENQDRSHVRAERNYGPFSRSFNLPDNVNKESINAKFENGVLEITLEKKEPEKPKEYQVNIN